MARRFSCAIPIDTNKATKLAYIFCTIIYYNVDLFYNHTAAAWDTSQYTHCVCSHSHIGPHFTYR